MSAYVLDSTVVIDHTRGRHDASAVVARIIEETGQVYTCDIITAEALSGGGELERYWIGRFLGALEYIAIDPDGARWAGETRRQLQARGRRSPAADALIAAVAWRMDATIVTRNPADFEPFGVPVLGYGEPIRS